MPINTRPLSKSDCHDAAVMTFDIWADNDFRQTALPATIPEHSINETANKLEKSVDDPDQSSFVAVDTDSGKVIAYSVWTYTPERSHEQWVKERDERVARWPGANLDLILPMFAEEAARREKVMGSQRWWELDTLAVHPDSQRQGVGKSMMKWGQEEMEKRNLQSVIVSTPRGSGLYTQFGYTEVDSWGCDLRPYGGPGFYQNKLFVKYPKGFQSST